MANAGVASYSYTTKVYNINSNITRDRKELFSRLTKYYLVHLDYFLFISKVGSNFYYKSNKNIRGKRCIRSIHSTKVSICNNNNNNYRFLVLEFTAATGKAIMTGSIIKAKRLTYE